MPRNALPNPDSLIKNLVPLNQIDRKYHKQLRKNFKLIEVENGNAIIRKNNNSKLHHYLIEGSVELRHSFEQRLTLSTNQQHIDKPLEHYLKQRSSIKAIEPCSLLVVNTEQIDELLAWSQDCNLSYLDDSGLGLNSDTLIDDDFQEDWDNAFIRSPLAANLSNTAIHQLLASLEDVAVKAGEQIVKKHSTGDYFYIVKQGQAKVLTDPLGPFQGEAFTLEPGSYFGDEALIAGTIRNAEVVMQTDGILGQLTNEHFQVLIRPFLLSPAPKDIYKQSKHIEILDVRLPLETKLQPIEKSRNIPIAEFRNHMDEFKESCLYIIAPSDDRRSDLATYLMRQAGFEAYQLPPPPTH